MSIFVCFLLNQSHPIIEKLRYVLGYVLPDSAFQSLRGASYLTVITTAHEFVNSIARGEHAKFVLLILRSIFLL